MGRNLTVAPGRCRQAVGAGRRLPVLFLAASFAFAAPSCCSAAEDPPLLAKCLQRLEMPSYPELARAARIQALASATISLSKKAVPQRINVKVERSTKTTEPLFKAAIERAIRNSRFEQSCQSKMIIAFFHFELREDASEKSAAAFGYPNHFWIRVGPFEIMPGASFSSSACL